ncbi:MAG: hypothetical protein ACI4XM_04950 [Candidatus Coprovivens sp.]
MSKNNGSSKESKEKNEKHILRYVLIVFLFILGFILGFYFTTRYLESRDNEETPIIEDDGIIDITEDKDSVELIESLLGILDKNPMFYSTQGISSSTMDNTSKLILIYNKIINKNLGTSEELPSLYYGSSNCANNFITDPSDNAFVYSNKCTTMRINKSSFVDINKQLFNDDILDVSVNFNPVDGVSCVVDGETYICGNVTKTSDVTGELVSVFCVVKATKDTDGTIVIYEKGYLNDKRSNVNNLNDQYDNYYLHSSDSKDYYYELKSADNLTFKHTFKTIDRQNYYYVSTELVKE